MQAQPEPTKPEAKRFDLAKYLALVRQPRYLAAAAFAAGALFGLIVLGWWLFPVAWTNASAEQLRPDLREDYLRAAIDSYSLHPNEAAAQARLNALGEAVDDAMSTVAAAPGDQSVETIAHFQSMLGLVVITPTASSTQTANTSSDETGRPAFSTTTVLSYVCGFTIVLGLAFLAVTYMKRRQTAEGKPAALKAREFTRGAPATDYGDAAPLSQWMTTYLIGDDLFDDSFSIDSPAGEFMGECGVGIAETIGVGSPKRVTAFEIWLFDKNDIQTVTKVLMSAHIFRDDAARERLSAKGEPVLANPGAETVLETDTLQLVARVVDMQYGEGALPEESFFERATLELAVWSKK